ncbi:IS3 family transposase [Actinoplanes regularis]|uniref:IS3 family transposase n=1 Tax=Actinoplanes regularis TaxID=52697 RepID=UPI0024A0B9A3|nr:IS3 family transposase [Actinoplanes regularis]GLW35189.1 hypothetical protein Areg01_81250 [Actinoplanes regularis]
MRDGELIHHSDRDSTGNYTSFRFADCLYDNGILPSMGSVGDSYDNALMENFWATLKIELVYRQSLRTRDEAENALFAYIDGWYNTHRIQKELGYLSPDDYDRLASPTANPGRTRNGHPCHRPVAGKTAPSKRGKLTVSVKMRLGPIRRALL